MKLRILGENKTAVLFKDGTEIFFSYETPVAGFFPPTGYARTTQKYSKTTTKHITEYLKDVDPADTIMKLGQWHFDNYMSGM